MKKLLAKMQTKLMMTMAGVPTDRENGDHLLEVLGVIIIAVVLLVMLRSRLSNMFTTAMTNTQTQVNNLFNPVT